MPRAKPYRDGKRHPQTTQRLVLGDCLTELPKKLPDQLFQLAILDPPYNLGKAYSAYHDDKPSHEYQSWLKQRLDMVTGALHKHGTLWLFIPDEWVVEADSFLRGTLALYRKSWVVWAYGFGVACQKNFSRSHCHILRYTKTKSQFTFHPEQIRVPSNRQLVYNDKRAKDGGKLPDDTWLLTKAQIDAVLPEDGDVWYESRVCGTFRERKRHSPNQIPLPIMERIVLSTSSPGDWVLDPFMGTGTVGCVCKQHERSYVGIDLSAECVEESQKRIEDYAG